MISHPVSPAKTYVLVLARVDRLAAADDGQRLSEGWPGRTARSISRVAFVKALLVMIFFMHLRSSHYLLRIVAVAGFFWLALLIGLAFTDVGSR